METLTLPHLPRHTLLLGLFTDVQNAPFLRRQLLEGNTEFEYAFLDCAVLISRTQILSACFRAINDSIQSRLKTRNVHAEIVFALSPNNNIAESFRRFGIQDSTTNVLAIKVLSVDSLQLSTEPSPSLDEVIAKTSEHLRNSIQGRLGPVTDEVLFPVHTPGSPNTGEESVKPLCDIPRLTKIYKIPSTSIKGSGKPSNVGKVSSGSGSRERRDEDGIDSEQEAWRTRTVSFVVGCIALKGS